MSRPLATAAAALALLTLGASCDSHSWEQTRVLYQHGERHGSKDGHDKHDGHGEKGEHGEKAAHGKEAASKEAH